LFFTPVRARGGERGRRELLREGRVSTQQGREGNFPKNYLYLVRREGGGKEKSMRSEREGGERGVRFSLRCQQLAGRLPEGGGRMRARGKGS